MRHYGSCRPAPIMPLEIPRSPQNIFLGDRVQPMMQCQLILHLDQWGGAFMDPSGTRFVAILDHLGTHLWPFWTH